jgi:hypothetical protein
MGMKHLCPTQIASLGCLAILGQLGDVGNRKVGLNSIFMTAPGLAVAGHKNEQEICSTKLLKLPVWIVLESSFRFGKC